MWLSRSFPRRERGKCFGKPRYRPTWSNFRSMKWSTWFSRKWAYPRREKVPSRELSSRQLPCLLETIDLWKVWTWKSRSVACGKHIYQPCFVMWYTVSFDPTYPLRSIERFRVFRALREDVSWPCFSLLWQRASFPRQETSYEVTVFNHLESSKDSESSFSPENTFVPLLWVPRT